LNDVLKKQLGFKGFIISDANAVGGANVLHYTAKDYSDAGKKAIENGLDVIFQTAYNHHQLFVPPFLDSSISSTRINDAVSRVLQAKFELGLFEHPYIDAQKEEYTEPEKKALAKKAALSSFVLLKNENGLLPLAAKYKSIAVIG
jgi:beta-glucosidase